MAGCKMELVIEGEESSQGRESDAGTDELHFPSDINLSSATRRSAPRLQMMLFLTMLTSLLFSSAVAQLSAGDRCTTPSNEAGVCRPFKQCPKANEQLSQGIRPKICGFDLNVPIICCATPTVTRPTRPTSNRNPSQGQSSKPTRPSSNGGGQRPGTRISMKKCEEYSAMVTEHIQALPLVLDPDPVSFDVENCPQSGLQLIVGGERTQPGEYPHMVAIGFRSSSSSDGYDWDCGGSLISESFVLTAAHCATTSKGRPLVARIGELSLGREVEGGQLFHPPGHSNGKYTESSGDYEIERVIRHPDYRPPAKYNDIALLKLKKPIKPFTRLVRPACLYTSNEFRVNRTTATGWGRVFFDDDPSDILLKVGLQIINQNTCNSFYESERNTKKLSKGIQPSMMCAGDLAGGKDTCQGDSGGPIQIQDPNNRCIHYVIGITSFGKVCGAPNPGVYTRVSHYVPWIESEVWPSRG